MLYLVGLEYSQCIAIKLMCACKILVQSHELFCAELTLSYLQALHSNMLCWSLGWNKCLTFLSSFALLSKQLFRNSPIITLAVKC